MPRGRKSGAYRNIGLLILRAGLGVMLMLHGFPKLSGGPEMWTDIGSAMQYLGIYFTPMFFGFMAAVIEFFGGLFLILGLFFRIALSSLLMVMFVAAASHIGQGDDFVATSQSIELAVVFISLLFIGPGRHSVDRMMHRRSRRY